MTIGNFDGVHRGHRALLAEVRAAADSLKLPACVMTFEPHPREFFAPHSAPARISNQRDKLEALSESGIDRVIVEHFNSSFAKRTPEQFVKEILVDSCHVRWIMVGEDFRYGSKRAGDLNTLHASGRRYGFEVATLPTVTDNGDGGVRVSSSAVRAALAAGDLERAQHLLGHRYFISGHVIQGHKLGLALGFPTANIRPLTRLPRFRQSEIPGHPRTAVSGIFVVQVHGIGDGPWPGVASIGVRPTVDDSGRVLLETHLFDFDQDLYGKLIRVEFLKKLREEEKYADVGTLTSAIAEDARQAREFFATHKSDAPSAHSSS